MFWDKVAGVYDLFENIYNKSVYQSYEKFFAYMGYEDIAYEVVRGRMSCDIAIIEVKKNL